MSMKIPDAMTNLEDSNIEIEGNELDDSNNEVDGNDPENASRGGEPSAKKKRIIFPKFCGTESHQLNQHVIKKTTKGNKYIDYAFKTVRNDLKTNWPSKS
ncbi:hypothetical protein H5410_009408 [Solanum commersonii]|uniref:Uncharacterized protein n=1 Tax=Solanum commersonii TaxID=4109 RepID=A0A9J6AHT9_SOLCO|nr:hypothetical protein H5410_009408 [Solanum commersonii]